MFTLVIPVVLLILAAGILEAFKARERRRIEAEWEAEVRFHDDSEERDDA